jgi:hypothetical protein
MSSLSIRLRFEPVRELAFGSISGTYMGVGSALSNPARQIFIQNLTDATLMFSFNGIDDHFPLPENGFFLNDITSNKTQAHGFYLAEGERLYVKEIGNPTSGSVYFTVMYGSDN